MFGWMRREGIRRWLDPTISVVGLVLLTVIGLILGSDNPVLAILVLPVAGVLFADLKRSLTRRPELSLDAATGATTTTTRNERRVAQASVFLFVKNAETAGPTTHCKVEIETVAAHFFHLDAQSRDVATEHQIDDMSRIVWQLGTLPPGGERELKLRSDEFAFDDDSVDAQVRVTADRTEPIVRKLSLRIDRYHGQAAEFIVSVTPEAHRAGRPSSTANDAG